MPSKVDSLRYGADDVQHTFYSNSGGSSVPPSEVEEIAVTNHEYNRHVSLRGWGNTPAYREKRFNHSPLPDQPNSLRRCSVWGQFFGTEPKRVIGYNPYEGTLYRRKHVTMDVQTAGLVCNSSLPEWEGILPDSMLWLKLREKLKEQSSWNSLVFLAEARKSADMIYNAADKIGHGLAQAHAVAPLGVAHALGVVPRKTRSKSAASIWLEYKYGWMPLLLDAHSAAKSIAELFDAWATSNYRRKIRVQTRRGYTARKEVDLSISPSIAAAMSVDAYCNKRASLEYTVDDPSLYAIQSLGVTNPLAIAWELLPLSFVYDWFLPIGDYLNTLDAGLGIKVSRLSKGTKMVWTEKIESVSHEEYPESSSNGARSYLLVDRDPYPEIPSVIPTDLLISPSLGAARLTTALALGRQRFR